MDIRDIKRLEERFEYTFKNKQLLIQAFTHTTYANENGLEKNDSNERLEFLGDAVLELVSSEYLYNAHPDMLEGELTKLRASIVSKRPLATFAFENHLGEFLLLGKGEQKKDGHKKESLLVDAVEALFGAIYLDSDLETIREFIIKNYLENLEVSKRFFDSKTTLQEMLQKDGKNLIEYRLLNVSGPDHQRMFEVEVLESKVFLGRGKGSSKKEAEQEAAKNAIIHLQLHN